MKSGLFGNDTASGEAGVYAVNVFDISEVPIFGLCFGQHCKSRLTVKPSSPDADEVGLVLECPAEQAEAIVKTLNIKKRVRAYRKGKGGAWVRV